MNARTDISTSFTDPDDLDNNRSANPHFQQVLNAGLNRRNLLRGGLGAAWALWRHVHGWAAGPLRRAGAPHRSSLA